jgi:hypothetical protein
MLRDLWLSLRQELVHSEFFSIHRF